MLRAITAEQFVEWQAYADLEPFDQRRADWRAAQVEAAIVNVMGRDATRHPEPFPVSDFVLRFGDDRETRARAPEQSESEMKAVAKQLALAFSEATPPADPPPPPRRTRRRKPPAE